LPSSFRHRLPAPREWSFAPLNQAEKALLAEPGPLVRTGVHRRLPATAPANGTWDTTAEGRQVWRLVVRSPGSTGIRVQFSEFSVGTGKVWLHDRIHSAGPYTGQGLFGNGVLEHTIFSSRDRQIRAGRSCRLPPCRSASGEIAHQAPVPQTLSLFMEQTRAPPTLPTSAISTRTVIRTGKPA
jgi:hypothetical protein